MGGEKPNYVTRGSFFDWVSNNANHSEELCTTKGALSADTHCLSGPVMDTDDLLREPQVIAAAQDYIQNHPEIASLLTDSQRKWLSMQAPMIRIMAATQQGGPVICDGDTAKPKTIHRLMLEASIGGHQIANIVDVDGDGKLNSETDTGLYLALQGLMRYMYETPSHIFPQAAPVAPDQNLFSTMSPFEILIAAGGGVDPVIQEDWYNILQRMLNQPNTCMARVWTYLPKSQDKIPIIFYHDQGSNDVSGYYGRVSANDDRNGIHLNTQKTAELEDTLCHELGHYLMFAHHEDKLKKNTIPYHDSNASPYHASTTPFSAFAEGFAEFVAKYNVRYDPAVMEYNANSFAKTLPTFEEREHNEFFVSYILLKIALSFPENYDRIMTVMTSSSNSVQSLGEFIYEYVKMYPNQRYKIEHILKAYGLCTDEPLPAWFPKQILIRVQKS